ncbi:hypothetical protein [Actinoplanes utahensis]|uniref:Uncharacterized protein n=1 Tax=Actinoplanes utahensis TaxID=1869 RepID=A0A0A6X0A8_ACTUT|nr:hypothetical protein [Actinoplanes utahensis]KHD73447.1 hypothetical protein MB27_35200 [Actinoplanes utahensis]GIF30235.1 hypothetical protein Aut01nite_32210 [Actinoplanes utahensis]
MARWATPSLRDLLETAGPDGRAEALTELRAALAGRDVPLDTAGPARIAAALLDEIAEPYLLQRRSVDRPDATRLASTPTGRDLRDRQVRFAERMRRRAVGVLGAEPPGTPDATHVRYLCIATGMLLFGDCYELIALIVTFPFDERGDPRRRQGARDTGMAVQAAAATRTLLEVGLDTLDTTYLTEWVRIMADAREIELRPLLVRWRQWAP